MKLTAKSALGLFHVWVGSSGAKLVRVMKLTTIIILVVCLHSSANGIAQNTVTFSGKDVNLESVFTAIKKQTSYRFFFNTSIIQNASKITIEVKNAPIEQVLNLALKDQSLTFAIKGRTIFVMKKTEEDNKSSQVMPLQGDPVTVSGRVTDEQGNPLAGANVKVKGTNNGVTTDAQGRFTLANVDGSGMLEISFVGHESQLLPIKGKTLFTVALGQKVGTLDETLVIAYGTTSRRFTTGNVNKVKGTEIQNQPVNNPILALEGRVPGLFIAQSNGLSGGGVTVRIQGQNSLFNGNDPLYVIDGVPYLSQLPSNGLGNILGNSGGVANGNSVGIGNPLSYINTSDIESIEVLKDADATAIYGSRAANGAILITTKRGKAGPVKVGFNFQKGWGKVTSKMPMLNTQEYVNMRMEAKRNDNKSITSTDYDLNGLWDTTRYTDWQKVLIGGTAEYTNMDVNVSGGNASSTYLIGSTYHRETTVFPGDFSDKRVSFHFNINSKSKNQKFQIQLTGNYLVDNNELPRGDITTQAILLEPNAPAIYNDDGSLNWMPNSAGTSTWTNPVSNLSRTYRNKTNNLVSNAVLSYQVLPGLQLMSSLGYTNMQTDEFQGIPLISFRPESQPTSSRMASYGRKNLTSWIIEPQINYNTKIYKGKLELLVGTTVQQNNNDGDVLAGTGYNSDQVLEDIRAASSVSVTNSFVSLYKYSAIFSRLNYNWQDKYIIQFNARRDGTSRFGAENQLHNFGSIGIAWLFSQEQFIQNNLEFLSFGKLRGSFGTTGNDQIGDYTFMNLFNPVSTGVSYQGITSLSPTGLSNPYLQWEDTRKIQMGIDLGVLHDRILLSAVYSRNRSSNQLLGYSLPSTAGFNSVTNNFPAMVQNVSWEFSLNSVNIKTKKISWSTSFNLTIPRNKLVEFPDLNSSTYASKLVIGEPATLTKVYNFRGVSPLNGKYIVADINGDTTSSPVYLRDATKIITTLPRFYGGFQSNIKFKGFQLDVLFQFVKQIGVSRIFSAGGSAYPGRFIAGSSNQPITVLDRWQKPGDNTQIAKFNSDATLSTSNVDASDASFSDASYIRLKNLSLSWQLPNNISKKIFQDFNLFIQGQNILTITRYKGMDPENQTTNSLPPLRMLTFGLRTSL